MSPVSLIRRFIAPVVVTGILLAVLPPPVQGQSVVQVLFLPQTFYVGDMVEARVVVRSAENLTLTIPENLPVTEWVTIHAVTVVQRADGFEVRILFQPFFTGTRQLPPIGLGAMELTGVSAFVSTSTTRSDVELEPIQDQVLLPGTRVLVAVTVFILFGLPLIIVLTSRWTRQGLAAAMKWYRERRPYRRLARSLRLLQGEMHDLDGKTFYIRLLDEARAFLDSRYDASILSATTGEMPVLLEQSGIDPATKSGIVEMFQFGDLVKFAHHTVSLEDRVRHLEQLRKVAAETRERERKHVGS